MTSAVSQIALKARAWAWLSIALVASCGSPNLIPIEQSELGPPFKTVTLVIKNYCVQPGNEYYDLFVSNYSVHIAGGAIEADFDRDGVPSHMDSDSILNISPRWSDTNLDGYSDLLVYLSGLTQMDQLKLKLCLDPDQDTDLDGLSDCEEDFLGTAPKNFDTDADGITDYLEVRHGLSPVNPDDAYLDPDGDRVLSIDEVRFNTPPHETNSDYVATMALDYDLQSKTFPTNGCYDTRISNIPIGNVSNGNLIRIQFIESAGLGLKSLRPYSIAVPREVLDGAVLEYEYSELN